MSLRDYVFDVDGQEMTVETFEYDARNMRGIVGVIKGGFHQSFQINLLPGQENVSADNVIGLIQQNYPTAIIVVDGSD